MQVPILIAYLRYSWKKINRVYFHCTHESLLHLWMLEQNEQIEKNKMYWRRSLASETYYDLQYIGYNCYFSLIKKTMQSAAFHLFMPLPWSTATHKAQPTLTAQGWPVQTTASTTKSQSIALCIGGQGAVTSESSNTVSTGHPFEF